MRSIDNRASLAAGALAELERLTARHASLEQVVRWAAAHTPPLAIADVVTQDEFTHDVVLPWRAHWLVYDTT